MTKTRLKLDKRERLRAPPSRAPRKTDAGRVLGFACGPHHPASVFLIRLLPRVRHVAGLQDKPATAFQGVQNSQAIVPGWFPC